MNLTYCFSACLSSLTSRATAIFTNLLLFFAFFRNFQFFSLKEIVERVTAILVKLGGVTIIVYRNTFVRANFSVAKKH